MKRKPKYSNPIDNVVRIDPVHPDPAIIRSACRTLHQNGVLVFPTSGLYGLGADARSTEAVRRIFALKRRPADKPVLVLVGAPHEVTDLVESVPDCAFRLMQLWPGGITLVFKAGKKVLPELTGGTGKIGVRLPAHAVARAVVTTFGGPITGTSANISGFPAAASAEALDPTLRRAADLVLDAGLLAGGPGSTIVDATVCPVAVLRQGAVSRQAIDDALAGRAPRFG